ncbi:substrate-binding domain-containing protein [Pseudonocardia acaciae]|uniref:substrate-binding domain-containing protein n=1 Tax=Pseudonocardia acaciae TaxID=551276 RepID=UPI0006879CEF|nr:substrate-binding domain-containing protein [Pseudonocardia acaciae]
MGRSRYLVRVVTIGAVAAALATAGCSAERTGGGGGAGGSNGPVKIGLVTKTDTNPYFVTLRDAAKAAAQQQGAELVALAGKFDGDNEGQVAAIENLAQQGVKGILITPSNSTGIIGALRKARDRGITVIALDTETQPKDAVDATWATNNLEAGEKQGGYVKTALNGAAPKLLMIDGTPGAAVDQQRHDGFLKGIGLAEGAPEIIGTQAANGDQNKAQQAMENLLARSTDVNAVYTINEPTGRGAYAALSAKGLAGKVAVGSIDGGCQGVQDVKSGKYAATVMQFPKKMAQEGVAAVVTFAKNGTKPSGFHDTGSELITDKPVPGLPSKDTAYGMQNCWG